jgi:DNA polymerase I-like protein with 3'-5' exonuclease and polymerase domains
LDGELKTTDATGARNQIWRDVRCMDGSDLSAAEPQLGTAAECAMVLLFTDQSSQLREQKAKPTKQVTEIDGVCVAVAGEESSSLDFFFLPLDPKNLSLDEWCKKQLLHLLLHTRVICYNAQEILTTLINHYRLHSSPEVWLKWRPLDVKVGAWLLDPDNAPDNFHQTLSRFNIRQPSSSTSHAQDQVCFDVLVCQDMSLLGPLMVALYHRLVETNLWDLFTEVETKLVSILGAMEATGVQVDTEKLLHFDELLKLRIAHVESTAHKAAKRVFSINSTQQLRKVLFDDLQLDKQCAKKLSKTNILKHKSTSESVLHQLQDLHPLPRLVLEYRQLCKMKATYITGLLPFISEVSSLSINSYKPLSIYLHVHTTPCEGSASPMLVSHVLTI